MKQIILPVVCAVLMIFAISSVNPELETPGYIFATVLGLFIGTIVNKLAFKKEASEKNEKDSVAK